MLVRIADLHENPEIYSRPERFDPHRFRGIKAAAPDWLAVRWREYGDASAPISPSLRWTSCCGRCCRTSGSSTDAARR